MIRGVSKHKNFLERRHQTVKNKELKFKFLDKLSKLILKNLEYPSNNLKLFKIRKFKMHKMVTLF